MGAAHELLCRASPLQGGEDRRKPSHALRALVLVCGLSPTGFLRHLASR